MLIKIVSWNIWIDGHIDQTEDFLRKSDADIIGLQEVKDSDPKHDIISFLKKLGYSYVFAPIEKEWGGNIYRDGPAIFSKHPILDSHTYNLSSEDNRGAVKADIQIGDKTLHVFSTHLVHSHQEEYKIQTDQAINLLKHLPTANTILMGDFNATPESSTIKAIKEVLIDSDPSNQPTWSVYKEGCGVCKIDEIKIKLDYIFTTPDIKTESFKVRDSKGSDHLPIITTIEL